MRVAVHQPQYVPWLGYFHKIQEADAFVYQDDVQYKHREYQNRNRIKTPEGPLWLTVPVLTRGKRGQSIQDVRINYEDAWPRKHWNALEKNYRGAPCFDQHAGFLEAFFADPPPDLCTLNIAFIAYALDQLGIDTPVYRESEIETGELSGEQRIIEVVRSLGADTYLSGAGGGDWMDLQIFEQAGIAVEFQHFEHPSYPQLYGPFMPYLSILDLLLNTGEQSRNLLFHD